LSNVTGDDDFNTIIINILLGFETNRYDLFY